MGITVTPSVVFFSEHFGLKKMQEELEFVDIPLTTDIALYVDPYAFKIGTDLWAIECNNLVVDFFQNVIDSIRADDQPRVRFLLGNLHEPNSTHFGLSKGRPQGRGVGGDQAMDLYERLKRSKAAKSGILKDLSDCELMIPGISHDKISDITINIIRKMLISFTELQCRLHKIPTRSLQAGPVWCAEETCWKNIYAKLPVFHGRSLMLVPKTSVRYRLAPDHQEYYHKFVLEYLQQENLNSNSSLVHILKNGKRRVTKKSLEELFPCDKEFLFEFSLKHPEVLQQYREFLPIKDTPLTEESLKEAILHLLGRLPGSETTNNTHVQIGEIVMQKNIVHGDNIGGVVGSGVVNARDIAVYKSHIDASHALDTETKHGLLEARKELEAQKMSVADKHDVADSLGKLTSELEKPEKDAGLVKRFFQRIKEVAPTVATVLGSIKTVADLVKAVAS
jgi:hypothetical protein